MPTDEQRKQFEQLMKEQGHKAFNRSRDGKYLNDHRLNDKWLGYHSRDTEVRRLVAALTSMVVEFDPSSENEIAAHKNAVMLLAEYLPEKEAVDAD